MTAPNVPIEATTKVWVVNPIKVTILLPSDCADPSQIDWDPLPVQEVHDERKF